MKVSELQGTLDQVKQSAARALLEIRTKIDALDIEVAKLTAQVASAELSPEVVNTINEIRGLTGQLDDIVPGAEELPGGKPAPVPPTVPENSSNLAQMRDQIPPTPTPGSEQQAAQDPQAAANVAQKRVAATTAPRRQ